MSNEALEEALLHVKEYRERAESAEKKVKELELARMSAVAAQGFAEEKLIGEQNRHERTKKKLKEERQRVRDLRKQIVDLQNELKSPEAQPIEIISFIDDCGHSVVINATGTAQKLKVYRGLIEDALEQGAVSDNEHYNYTELLKTGTLEELMEAINDSDINTGGCSREGFDAVAVCNEWPGADLCG